MPFWTRPRARSAQRKSRRVSASPRLLSRGFQSLEDRQLLATVHIDSAWLSQRGAGPYLLDASDSTYVLDTDVTTNGTAFVVGGKNITLDLNGHTVTYGNSAPISVYNGGFEQGTAGWDLSQAPSAKIASNTHFLWGAQELQLANISGTQTILSDPINIPAAGREYAATITPKGPWDGKLTLSVVDAVTGATLASGDSADPDRGFSAVAKFVPTTTHAVQLKVSCTPASGSTSTFSLDNATLTPAEDYGVVATGDPAMLPSPLQTSAITAAANNEGNFTLRNGHIVQGRGDGYASAPIYTPSSTATTIDGVDTYATGTDTSSVDATWAGNIVIRNSTFRSAIDNITNRMVTGGVISLGRFWGSATVEGNHIVDAPQVGVLASGGSNLVIRNNVIDPNTVVSNGYGVLLDEVHDFEVSGNKITTPAGKSGRGIMIDGVGAMSDPTSTNGEIFGNTVDVHETLSREYGWEAPGVQAFRFRTYDDAGLKNIHVHDNTFIARSGPGYTLEAVGMRVSIPSNNAGGDLGNVIENNVFKAIVESTNTQYYGQAVSFEGVGANAGPLVRGNVFESNDTSLRLTGEEGDVLSGDFISNTLRRSSEGAARTYRPFLSGFWIDQIHNVRLFDMRYENGATADISWDGEGTKDLSTGSLLTVRAQDSSGAPVAGAPVTLRDKDNVQVFSGKTDSNGMLSGIPVVTSVYTQSGTDPAAIGTDSRGPFRLTVTIGGQAITQSLTLAQSQQVTVTPGGIVPASLSAKNDSYSTNEDTRLSPAAPGVLGNDAAAAGKTLTASVVTGPAHGTLTLNVNGSFSYTPAANYSGSDSFTYRAYDGSTYSNNATVSITVSPVNDAPTAANDSYTTKANTALAIAAPGVLANDKDVEGSALTASLVAGPSHGTLSLKADGSFSYTPAAGYAGSDSFTYRASDGAANSNTATVTLTVTAATTTLGAKNDSYSTTKNKALSVAAPGVLANDTAAAGKTLTASVVTRPAHGTLTLNANGSFSYTPAANYTGSDSFTYRANDGSAYSNTATVSLTVTASATSKIVDDGNTGYSQTGTGWTTSGVAGTYAGDSRWHVGGGTGQATAQWKFSNLVPGSYEVYASWAPYSNRATNAPYAVSAGGQQFTTRVNQQAAANDLTYANRWWGRLGSATVDSTGSLTVTLSDDADQVVSADAILVKPAPKVSVTGAKLVISAGDPAPAAADGTDFGTVAQGKTGIIRSFVVSNVGTAGLTLGSVSVPAGYTVVKGLATGLPPGAYSTLQIRLDTATAGTKAGEVRFATNDPSCPTVNFAITGKVTAATPTGTVTKIVDDGDPGYSETGTYWSASGLTGTYGGDSRWHTGGGGGLETARWAFSGLAAGTYDVYASWGPNANRATNAAYTVSAGGQQFTTQVNQQAAANDLTYGNHWWGRLGTAKVDSTGKLTVTLSDDADQYVSADAILVRSSAQMLTLAGTAPTVSTADSPLTQAELDAVSKAALARWAAAGLPTSVLTALSRVQFVLADLPDQILGEATPNTITIDRDAAGLGWFVDTTPNQDEEYRRGRGGELRAVAKSAVDRVDLLTVVSHELGHIAGLEDLAANRTRLMSGELPAGVRRLPGHAEADAVFDSYTG